MKLQSARETRISPSSRGCLSASSRYGGNSRSSSKKSVPKWASVISHGRAFGPPPRRLATLARGCTLANGRREENGSPIQATERIFATVRISSSETGGRIPANARQRSVFPDPGAHSRRTLCHHAAAISSARFARSWPEISEKSGMSKDFRASPPEAGSAGETDPFLRFSSVSTALRRDSTPYARIHGTIAASRASESGTTSSVIPHSANEAAWATMPPTLRTVPSSASSPNTATFEKSLSPSRHSSATMPSAMARSNHGHAFRISAGARLTVIRFEGNEYHELRTAVRTRSRLSCTAVSPRPTTENDGSHDETSVSTETGCQNRPRTDEERMVLTMKKARKKIFFALPKPIIPKRTHS